MKAKLKINGILTTLDVPEDEYLHMVDEMLDAGFEIEGLSEDQFVQENERLNRIDAQAAKEEA